MSPLCSSRRRQLKVARATAEVPTPEASTNAADVQCKTGLQLRKELLPAEAEERAAFVI